MLLIQNKIFFLEFEINFLCLFLFILINHWYQTSIKSDTAFLTCKISLFSFFLVYFINSWYLGCGHFLLVVLSRSEIYIVLEKSFYRRISRNAHLSRSHVLNHPNNCLCKHLCLTTKKPHTHIFYRWRIRLRKNMSFSFAASSLYTIFVSDRF